VKEMMDKSDAGGWKVCRLFMTGNENLNAVAIYCNGCYQQLPSVLQKEDRYGA
jgi:hypothetical protein